jgi:hypothetical protein
MNVSARIVTTNFSHFYGCTHSFSSKQTIDWWSVRKIKLPRSFVARKPSYQQFMHDRSCLNATHNDDLENHDSYAPQLVLRCFMGTVKMTFRNQWRDLRCFVVLHLRIIKNEKFFGIVDLFSLHITAKLHLTNPDMLNPMMSSNFVHFNVAFLFFVVPSMVTFPKSSQ